MKKLVIIMFAFMATMSIKAQIVKDLEYPKGHFGIRGAFTLNKASGVVDEDYYDDDEDSKAFPYASLGLAADFKISSIPLYLETGLYYVNNGLKTYYDEKSDDHSVKMPLLMSYHLYLNDNMAIQPFVGPYVGYGFDQERADAGIRAGLGWNLGRLYANVGYDVGFEIDGYKNNTFFATVGFNFVGKY